MQTQWSSLKNNTYTHTQHVYLQLEMIKKIQHFVYSHVYRVKCKSENKQTKQTNKTVQK